MKDELWDSIARGKGFLNIKDAIQKLYVEAELSDEKVAERLECSTPTARTFRMRFDIPGRKPIPAKAPVKDIKNLSVRDLADKHKFSKSTAWRLKKKHFPEPHDV